MDLKIAKAVSKPSTEAFVELQEILWAEDKNEAYDEMENDAQNPLEHQLLKHVLMSSDHQYPRLNLDQI